MVGPLVGVGVGGVVVNSSVVVLGSWVVVEAD